MDNWGEYSLLGQRGFSRLSSRAKKSLKTTHIAPKAASLSDLIDEEWTTVTRRRPDTKLKVSSIAEEGTSALDFTSVIGNESEKSDIGKKFGRKIKEFSMHSETDNPNFKKLKPPQASIISRRKEMRELTLFEDLRPGFAKYQMIARYVRNSHELPKSQGEVQIEAVLKATQKPKPKAVLPKGEPSSSAPTPTPSLPEPVTQKERPTIVLTTEKPEKDPSAVVPAVMAQSPVSTVSITLPAPYNQRDIKVGTKKPQQLLLWMKTSPETVGKLARKEPCCYTFFDRLAPAFGTDLNDVKLARRQIILLCSVRMGRVQRSKQGYRYWSEREGPEENYGVVKAYGQLEPDWDDNEYDNSIAVPNGMTLVSDDEIFYCRTYNEYFVFDPKRITVRYAVDLEIVPKYW